MIDKVVLTRVVLPGPDGVKGTNPAPSLVFDPVISGYMCALVYVNSKVTKRSDLLASQGAHEQCDQCSW